MEFAIGDQVIDPRYGVGEITGTEQLELVDGFTNYYVIEIPGKTIAVRVPVRKMEEVGVRPVMSKNKVTRILEVLGTVPGRLSNNYKTRQARLQEKLKTGRPLKLAEAIRDMAWRKHRSHLTKSESGMFSDSLELLATEVALVRNMDIIQAQELLNDTLDAAIAASGKAN